jgi:hypothetical protein
MTEVSFTEESKTAKPKISKSKKPMKINQPQPRQAPQQRFFEAEPQDNYVFNNVVPNEMKGGLKNIAITGLSYPAGPKKSKMTMNLHQSTYTNAYLDRYLCIDMIKCLDDHSKFLCVYLFNFLDAYLTPNIQQSQPLSQKPTKQNTDDTQNLN